MSWNLVSQETHQRPSGERWTYWTFRCRACSAWMTAPAREGDGEPSYLPKCSKGCR